MAPAVSTMPRACRALVAASLLAVLCPGLAVGEEIVPPTASHAGADTAEAAASAAEQDTAGAANATAPSSEGEVGGEEAQSEEAAEAAALAEAMVQARQDLESVAANLTTEVQVGMQSGANLRGFAAWGHGIFGETCCMCARRFGFNTILYAAADYTQAFGSHAAYWWCNAGCEAKCRRRGGHKFGCYDEQHLIQMDAMYGHRGGYQIMHDSHFGNIC